MTALLAMSGLGGSSDAHLGRPVPGSSRRILGNRVDHQPSEPSGIKYKGAPPPQKGKKNLTRKQRKERRLMQQKGSRS